MLTTRLRSTPWRAAAIAATLLAVFVADAVYAGLRFRSSFENAACDLKRAARVLERFDVAKADASLLRALDEIDAARRYLRHPALRIAGSLPFLEADFDVLDDLTEVAAAAVRSGRAGTDLAQDLGLSENSSLGAIYSDGKVDLDALGDAVGSVERIREHLATARATLENTPRAGIGRIRVARRAAASLVEEALDSVADTATVLGDLPAILGGNGERTYLLAFQAPSEARGGGGLIGVYGLLRARDGALEMLEVAPIRDLVPRLRGKVSGPRWFRDLYGGLDGLGGWREANSSPTFPASSRILLKMYERSTGEGLDGVMAMDPVVLADLLDATGPITTAAYPGAVDSANAGRILMRDIYVDFAQREDEQNDFLRELVDEIWARLGSGDVDPRALTEAVSGSIAAGRLKFYPSDPAERDSIRIAGLDGDPRSRGENVQMIFHNNFAANKIDWFLQRSQSTTLSIDEDGNGHFVTVMQLENGAPRGQRSLLKKSDVNELPAGLNLMSLHFMLPERAIVNEVYSGSTPIEHFDGLEAGRFPTVWTPLQLAVGARARVSVGYSVPDLVTFEDGRADLRMSFLPQGLVRADDFALSVTVPEGYSIGTSEDGRFHRSGTLETVRSIKARIGAPGVSLGSGRDPLASLCS